MKHLTRHRTVLGDYIIAGRHLLKTGRAKDLKQIAAETGMSVTTVRRWARIDHAEEWKMWWPSFEDVVADIFGDRFGRQPTAFLTFDEVNVHEIASDVREC